MKMSTSGKKHMNKILLDTNVLIYAIDADSKYHKKSLELLTDIQTARAQLQRGQGVSHIDAKQQILERIKR